jgi:hypothetical protein
MWQKTVYNIKNQLIDKKEFLFTERQDLFVDGSVIDRQISIFDINRTVIYNKLKNNADQLLNSWGTLEDRNTYQSAIEKHISLGNIAITDEGSYISLEPLPKFSVSIQQPNTKHIKLANNLCDWLRNSSTFVINYVERSDYPALKTDFKFAIDVIPLEGFTFYYNDINLESAINDYISLHKIRHPFL